jgi:hypothetical protein
MIISPEYLPNTGLGCPVLESPHSDYILVHLERNMVGDAFDQGVLNPLRRKFSAPPKQKIFLIRELRSTQFKGLYRS